MSDGLYVFPFAIAVFIWTLISAVLTMKNRHRPACFLPMVIPGLVLVSMTMAVYEGVWLYTDYGLKDHSLASLIAAFGVPFCV